MIKKKTRKTQTLESVPTNRYLARCDESITVTVLSLPSPHFIDAQYLQ